MIFIFSIKMLFVYELVLKDEKKKNIIVFVVIRFDYIKENELKLICILVIVLVIMYDFIMRMVNIVYIFWIWLRCYDSVKLKIIRN